MNTPRLDSAVFLSAFKWTETKEGYQFWAAIDKEYYDEIHENNNN